MKVTSRFTAWSVAASASAVLLAGTALANDQLIKMSQDPRSGSCPPGTMPTSAIPR